MKHVARYFLVLLLTGCVNEDIRLYEVELTADISDPAGRMGPVTVIYQHRERTAPGPLAYPLVPIESVSESAPGVFRHRVLVPRARGEGLVAYAWMDLNADGELCRPGTPPEPAGLVQVNGFPAHALSYRLELTTACAGAETLFPK
jgi:hypothetical protein